MKPLKAVTLLLFIATFQFVSLKAKNVEEEKYEALLLDSLFKNYDKRIRPVKNYHSAIEVNLSVSFQQILQVDEKHQLITTNVWRSLYWKDEFLIWNSENFGNITQISIERTQIWKPILVLYNSASYDKYAETHITNVVSSDGRVMEVFPMILKSTCKIDVKWFPFDEQKCFLAFGSWSVPSSELNLELHEYASFTKDFVGNGEWKLLGTTAVKKYDTYPCCPNDSFIRITYTIHLKRRAFYYFFSLLVPCALIGFLAVLGFSLPPESGEKLPLGATILFSLIVFLNMISESMPANADTVPLLGTYFNCIMFTIALSVVSTVVVNLNLNALNPKEVQGLSRNIFLRWLPWIMRLKTPPNVSHQMDGKIGGIIPFYNNQRGHVDSITSLGISSDRVSKEQWKFIAFVVDRLCLILSILFTFISVIILIVS